jgi:acetyl esterase/lipase
LDARARRLLGLIQAAAPTAGDDELMSLRRATDALADFAAPPPAVDREDLILSLPGRLLPARAYSPLPAGGAPLPGLVYFHGGGLISGGLASHDSLCAELSHTAECRIFAVDYRLGPEFRFPAAHDDARDAVNAIAGRAGELGVDLAHFGVGGDSAGGNLAAFAVTRSDAPLRLLFLLCPVLDMLAREPSRRELGSGFLIEEATMQRYWAHYKVEGLASDDARVAPLRAGGFSAYPPTRIHSAEYDPLKDEAAAFAAAIAAAGGQSQSRVYEGLIHHFYGLTAVIPSARAALAMIGADLADGLARAG